MPYITMNDRKCIETGINTPRNAGELNYTISALMNQYIVDKGLSYASINDCLGALETAKLVIVHMTARDEVPPLIYSEDNSESLCHDISFLIHTYYKDKREEFSALADILGAAEGAKMEFYRRVAAPYEDKKREENGDVYSPDVLTD